MIPDDGSGRAQRRSKRSGREPFVLRFTSVLISSSALYSAPAETWLSAASIVDGHLDWHRAAHAESLDTRSGSAECRSSDTWSEGRDRAAWPACCLGGNGVSPAEDRRLVIDQERGARAGIDENGFADQAPVCTGHPLVNLPVRTNTRGQKTLIDVIYGKQTPTNAADRDSTTGFSPINCIANDPARAPPVRPRQQILPELHMACANIVSSTVQRRRNAVRLGKTLVDDRQQCTWRERLAHTARRAKFERHPQEIGGRRHRRHRRPAENLLRVPSGGPDAMRPAVECDGRVAAADGSALPATPRPRRDRRRAYPVRPFVGFSCRHFVQILPLEFGLRVAGVRRPEIGFARKAGDCFGFSPSFTEWIFVLSDRGRF